MQNVGKLYRTCHCNHCKPYLPKTMISDFIMDDNRAASNKKAALQTTTEKNEHKIDPNDLEQSETDILAQYQERYRRRKSNGDQRPTKATHGEKYASSVSSSNTTCCKESLYILFTWISYGFHLIIVLLPFDMLDGSIAINEFYDENTIQISAASWNVIQWLFVSVWQGTLLVYLSLNVAEHTIKIFDNGFYIWLGIADIGMAIWDILTEQQSYLGRCLILLGVVLCLFYVNYVVLKHIFYTSTFDVTMYTFPSHFKMDPMPTPSTKATPDTHFTINSNGNMPPLTITTNNKQQSSCTASRRNINAYIERMFVYIWHTMQCVYTVIHKIERYTAIRWILPEFISSQSIDGAYVS